MDIGKRKTYGIIEKDGEIVKEGYVLTSREEFNKSKISGVQAQ